MHHCEVTCPFFCCGGNFRIRSSKDDTVTLDAPLHLGGLA